MQFRQVGRDRIEREWPDIAMLLLPAVRQAPGWTMQAVYDRLMTGPDVMVEIAGPAHGLVVLEVTEDLVCWTKWVAGRIDGGPKRRIVTMRNIVRTIEGVARAAGCKEHRFCGRDYSRIFPDYEPFDGERNGLRKVL